MKQWERWHECDCYNRCRVEPQPPTDIHHVKCPRYDDKTRVVKITHEGTTLIDTDIEGALQGLVDSDNGYIYEIEFTEMLCREVAALSEFAGY